MTALAVGVLLGGCSFFVPKESYVFPVSGDPSAMLRMYDSDWVNLSVINLSKDGCYAGSTLLTKSVGLTEARVWAGKSLLIGYGKSLGHKSYCEISFSFTPQVGANYDLRSGSWSENKAGLLPGFTREQEYCGVVLVKAVEGVESVEPIQMMRVKPGLSCHSFVRARR
ncbi:hypothetical protein BVH01_01895 [Pseudomonas sp. PA1(2017)]|nr:hypothetical protein BVH01_01895 [Pseudomonas sp. PA1(2017)]